MPSPPATASLDVKAGARLFRVLGDPTRLVLVRRLAEGPANVGELVEAVGSPSRSRVTNHLACLAWCGLVTADKVGRSVVYTLVDPAVLALLDLADEVAKPHAQHLASCTRIGPDWV